MSSLALTVPEILSWFGPQAFVPVAVFIAASAAIEHVFPPYPGDLAVAFGAALGFARGWSVALLFVTSLLGSLAGSSLTYYLGRKLATHSASSDSPRMAKLRAALDPGVAFLARRGILALVISRFLPVVRAVVIVAAGYARVPAGRALIASMAGCALWNGLLFTVGALVGRNLERISQLLAGYSRVVAAIAVVAGLAWLVHALQKSRKPKPDAPA